MPAPRHYLHGDLDRTDYLVSPTEITQLAAGSGNNWKDFTLVCVSIGLPCLINGISEARGQAAFTLTLAMFLNFLVGGVGLALSVFFGIVWYKTRGTATELASTILSRPRLEMNYSVTDVGELEGSPAQADSGAQHTE